MGFSTAAVSRKHGHSIGFNLSLIATVVAVGGLALAYLIDAARQGAHPTPARGTVTQTIGSTELHLPAAWVDGPPLPAGGFAKQIDLTLMLPLGPDAAMRKIDVTLSPRSRVRPSAAMLDGVYLHQFMPEQVSGPPDLVGKPLAASAGYENETVWYDPLGQSPFVAKCQSPVVAGQPGHCLRTVYLGPGIAAVYGFDDDVLGKWKEFDAKLHPLLVEIGAM